MNSDEQSTSKSHTVKVQLFCIIGLMILLHGVKKAAGYAKRVGPSADPGDSRPTCRNHQAAIKLPPMSDTNEPITEPGFLVKFLICVALLVLALTPIASVFYGIYYTLIVAGIAYLTGFLAIRSRAQDAGVFLPNVFSILSKFGLKFHAALIAASSLLASYVIYIATGLLPSSSGGLFLSLSILSTAYAINIYLAVLCAISFVRAREHILDMKNAYRARRYSGLLEKNNSWAIKYSIPVAAYLSLGFFLGQLGLAFAEEGIRSDFNFAHELSDHRFKYYGQAPIRARKSRQRGAELLTSAIVLAGNRPSCKMDVSEDRLYIPIDSEKFLMIPRFTFTEQNYSGTYLSLHGMKIEKCVKSVN
ncbi:hypothetical protein GU700_19120 [Methylobacterium sp. NI91]|nr:MULTISPECIES: hypothetical protein [unclassified Methylobacterium]QIJ76500.1 hypothetical protein CLZ_19115 [Methylobacterium sp. CLZ]QIJ81403.1 hypothetical protein GU700_19120 [Methylobacterium sp. NI91]